MALFGGQVLRARLGHDTGGGGVRHIYNPGAGSGIEITTEYALTPLALTRPSEGTTTTQITCPVCRKELRFRIASASTVRRQRILYLVLGLGLAAYAVVNPLRRIGWYESSAAMALQWIAFLAFLGAVAGAVVLLVKAASTELRRAVIVPSKRDGLETLEGEEWKKKIGHTIFPRRGGLHDYNSL
jgi:hypothetical protein